MARQATLNRIWDDLTDAWDCLKRVRRGYCASVGSGCCIRGCRASISVDITDAHFHEQRGFIDRAYRRRGWTLSHTVDGANSWLCPQHRRESKSGPRFYGESRV